MNQTSALLPWDIHPGLTPERLQVIAALLRRVRDTAVDGYSILDGDGPWSLGCTIYERSLNALRRLDASGEYAEWFSLIENEPLRVVFGLERYPLRFFRGEAGDDPPAHQLKRHAEEIEAAQLALSLYDEPPAPADDGVSRLVVEESDDQRTARVVFVHCRIDGTAICLWEIPLDGSHGILPIGSAPAPVDLGPPMVGVPVPATSDTIVATAASDVATA
jgi:hypothetical protein